ncbi:hypothetical protein BDZ94DRAFT_1061835 [Collybia nuda]|uniref:Uncharacterized protein n=1 Tax=Collybia nuda TaxID=64659 RepID=A0A9P5XYM0_9AGAR|nr:hypothetical protein BDZ94DRAFT_1061835 [Collybia nuda]
MPAAHDIYAEQLRDLRRGHPLYHPEPRAEGPVEIGDVGYIKDGAFRRLFNVSRPPDDPVQRFGVPDDFVQLNLGAMDRFDAVLEPGPLHSRTISTISTEVGTPGEILPAEASFHFSCSSKRGAILMLETQMNRAEAVQSRRLEAYVIQHCRSWHGFARDLDIHIGFGDLMLVTECSKTAAWSSAVYSNNSTEFGLSFSVGMPFTTAGVAASRSLEKIGPVERRRSQKRAKDHDRPLPNDHTVFIKAYRVGIRQMYYRSLVSLFTKARASGPAERIREDRSGSSQSPSSSRSPSPPSTPSDTFVVGPYESDFYAPIALLALEMEVCSSILKIRSS